MPEIDSPATGRRDIDEIKITPEMIEAGYSAYCQDDSLKEDEAEMIARIFVAMIVKSPLALGRSGGS